MDHLTVLSSIPSDPQLLQVMILGADPTIGIIKPSAGNEQNSESVQNVALLSEALLHLGPVCPFKFPSERLHEVLAEKLVLVVQVVVVPAI
jgi:hypothetical protein